ncbi:MAG: DUF1573 domain-containing protein [Opitutales bacterium]
MPFSLSLRIAAGLIIVALPGLRAELTFDRTVIEATIQPGEKHYPFAFPFENTGDQAVIIEHVKTSCGCTTTQLAKKTYRPGETGIIEGRFAVGNRQGHQHKKVRVHTNDLSQPVIALGLKLDIPRLVTVKPGLLLWRAGTEPTSKSVTILPNRAFGVRILGVESGSDTYAVSAMAPDEASGAVEVVVAPLDTTEPSRGIVKIRVGGDSLPERTLYAHALVR